MEWISFLDFSKDFIDGWILPSTCTIISRWHDHCSSHYCSTQRFNMHCIFCNSNYPSEKDKWKTLIYWVEQALNWIGRKNWLHERFLIWLSLIFDAILSIDELLKISSRWMLYRICLWFPLCSIWRSYCSSSDLHDDSNQFIWL